MPLVSRTRATLRRAEFGFLGVVVYTRVQTPRRWGAPFSAGVLPLDGLETRPFLTSCWMVGTTWPFTLRPVGFGCWWLPPEQSTRATDRRKSEVEAYCYTAPPGKRQCGRRAAAQPTRPRPAPWSASVEAGVGQYLTLAEGRSRWCDNGG